MKLLTIIFIIAVVLLIIILSFNNNYRKLFESFKDAEQTRLAKQHNLDMIQEYESVYTNYQNSLDRLQELGKRVVELSSKKDPLNEKESKKLKEMREEIAEMEDTLPDQIAAIDILAKKVMKMPAQELVCHKGLKHTPFFPNNCMCEDQTKIWCIPSQKCVSKNSECEKYHGGLTIDIIMKRAQYLANKRSKKDQK
jgi:hypothetical protein